MNPPKSTRRFSLLPELFKETEQDASGTFLICIVLHQFLTGGGGTRESQFPDQTAPRQVISVSEFQNEPFSKPGQRAIMSGYVKAIKKTNNDVKFDHRKVHSGTLDYLGQHLRQSHPVLPKTRAAQKPKGLHKYFGSPASSCAKPVGGQRLTLTLTSDF
jgi:hypothetical protein